MKIASTLALLCLVGAAGQANAQVWTTVASQNGQTLAFDAASVTDDGQTISFTTRVTFSPPNAYALDSGQALEGVAEAVEVYAVDCRAHTFAGQSGRYTDAQGRVLANNRTPGAPKPIGTVTQSLVGGLVSSLCPS